MNSQTESEASEAVSEMFDQQVAFFNIGKKHAFFLCSPDEARHAMDCIREWREGWNSLNDLKERRDAFKAQIMALKEWERVPASRQVVSTGGCLSLSALVQSFATIEFEFKNKGPVVDIIVVGALRHADIRYWGATVYDEASLDEKKSRGVYCRVFDADVYVDNGIPPSMVLVASMPCAQWEGCCSRVEVTVGS